MREINRVYGNKCIGKEVQQWRAGYDLYLEGAVALRLGALQMGNSMCLSLWPKNPSCLQGSSSASYIILISITIRG